MKERFNKVEIEIDSEYKSQLKRFRKPPLLLSKKNHLPIKLRNILACLTKAKKCTKKDTFIKLFLYPKLLLFLHVFNAFSEVVKTKITSYQTLRYPSCFHLSKFCATIIAKFTFVTISRFLDKI